MTRLNGVFAEPLAYSNVIVGHPRNASKTLRVFLLPDTQWLFASALSKNTLKSIENNWVKYTRQNRYCAKR